MKKLLSICVLLFAFAGMASGAATYKAPGGGIDTSQLNHLIVCDSHYASIQACINAAGTSESVLIPFGQHLEESLLADNNTDGVTVLDLRTATLFETSIETSLGNLTGCQTTGNLFAVTTGGFDCIAPPQGTGGGISPIPDGSQSITQPTGTNMSINTFEGTYYASMFQTGSRNNGISNLMNSANCATASPTGLSGCTVIVDPTYPNTEKPQGYGTFSFGDNINNTPWPMDTHVHDERNGVTADYYENPFAPVPGQSVGHHISSAITLDYQKWPSYNGNLAGSEDIETTDYAGGYNFDNYFGAGQPEYFFKTYYTDLYLASTNYTSGQQEAFQNLLNCHGVGDCLAMTTLVTCDGGVNSANDEGCHGGDFTIREDPLVYRGTVTAAAAVGTTKVVTNGTAGQGTEGQDRQLLDTNAAVVISGNSITGYAGATPTGPSGNSSVNPLAAVDSNANFPVSTMVQLCYAGSNNGVGGAAGCTAGSQPTGFIPSAPNMINPATSVVTNVVASYTAVSSPQTGLPAGFCTPTTLQSSNSGSACYLPPSGTACITDQEEYETVNYTYDSTAQQVTLLNLRFPHMNGLFFAHGGLCGYGVESQADVFSGDGNSNGISQVFPVEGSPNSTTFYYVSQRTNLGYTLPILGISNEVNGGDTTGGGECFALNVTLIQLQSDNRTVLMASNMPFNSGTDLSPISGMTLTINTSNASYNGNYVVQYGVVNDNANEFSYTLPSAPTGTAPTSGTASFCNTKYKLYPAVRVNSVLNTATNRVDGTMTTMPLPVAFASGDTVMEAHYPWISTAHDSGRGINQFLPRMYNGGSLYGMSYNYLLTGRPFVGFQINNQTDQSRYLGYGGTHIQPGIGYDLGGDWYDSFVANQAPDEAVIKVGSCKPGPIGCNNAASNFNVLLMPDNEALNYDPKLTTWTFGMHYAEVNNPPLGHSGTVQAWNMNAFNNLTGGKVGVSGSYLFNLGGAVGLTSTPNSPVFNNWFANFAYGFGAQNSATIDTYIYRGSTADSLDCGTGIGDTSCTFLLGTLKAGTLVQAPTISATISLATPSFVLNGGTPLTGLTSNNALIVVCPVGGQSGQFCDPTGHWITPAANSQMVYPAAPGIVVYGGSNQYGTSLTAPSSALVGVSDTQTLSNKTVDGVSPLTMAYLDPTSSIQTQLNGKLATNGNAVTASALLNTPSLCPQGQFPLGITASGNATGCQVISGGSGTGIINSGNGIGTVQYTGNLTDGSFTFKTCNVGSSTCSGGVGTNPPSSNPTNSEGLNSPSAGTGTSNAVGVFTVSTALPHTYTDALWTVSPNNGEGIDSTATNFSRDMWIKVALPAGTTNIEFDTFAFDDGWDWMWGNQCSGSKKLIEYDNQGNGWVDTPVPCSTLYDGNWHHIQETFHRDLAGTNNCANNSAPCEWWDGITIDGTSYVIGKSLPATTSSWQGSGGQVQLDVDPNTASSGSPATATLYVDTDIVSAGTAPAQGSTGPGGAGGVLGDLFSNDFDTGATTGLTVTGSPSLVQTNPYTPPYAAEFPSGQNYYSSSLTSAATTLYARFYLRLNTGNGSGADSIFALFNGGTNLYSLYLNSSNNVLTWFNHVTSTNAAVTTTPISAGTYHYVEIYWTPSATNGTVTIKIDGTTDYTGTGLNTGTLAANSIEFGNLSAATGWDVSMDNVDVSDQGWLGPVVLGGSSTGSTASASIAAEQQQSYVSSADTGTANAYAVTLAPVPAIVLFSKVVFRAANSNTGASTLTVNGGSAVALNNGGTTALVTGNIIAGQVYVAVFDGTEYQLMNPSTPATTTVANTTITVAAAAIPANSCLPTASTYSTKTMTGVTTSTTFTFTWSTDYHAVTGWNPANAVLYFTSYPTANTLNWQVCNGSSAPVTPSASTVWNVSAK